MTGSGHVLAVQAVGDAPGVPYESLPPATDRLLCMSGGGPGHYEPGEYNDDTKMSVSIARAAPRSDLRTHSGLTAVAEEFVSWVQSSPPDIGTQTAAATRGRRKNPTDVLAGMREAALGYHQRHPRNSAGNGALMRTSVVGTLPYDREEIARVAGNIAAITHPDPLCVQSSILWAEAVRVAHTDGLLDITAGLDPRDRDPWAQRISAAATPSARDGGGFTVTCLGDTDTVAGVCAAPSAAWTASPESWLGVHGRPNMDMGGLLDLWAQVAQVRGTTPTAARHQLTGRRRWLPGRHTTEA